MLINQSYMKSAIYTFDILEIFITIGRRIFHQDKQKNKYIGRNYINIFWLSLLTQTDKLAKNCIVILSKLCWENVFFYVTKPVMPWQGYSSHIPFVEGWSFHAMQQLSWEGQCNVMKGISREGQCNVMKGINVL